LRADIDDINLKIMFFGVAGFVLAGLIYIAVIGTLQR
jgi:hypothetical protein